MVTPTVGEKRKLFEGHALFGKLPPDDLDALLPHTRVEHHAAGREIFATGSPGRSMMAILSGSVRIALAPEWQGTARGGVVQTTYGGTNRRDNAFTLGATVTYSVWQSLGLTFDFQHTQLSSNVALTGFTNDAVTLGLSYKY